MKKIDFTVLVPVYNTKAAELIEAVFSVSKFNQTIEQDYHIVLVDDGSTSKETGDALEFLKRALDVVVLTMPVNGGTSKALNAGHEFITTEYIALHGSSDIAFKDKFRIQVEHLALNPDIDVLGTNLFSYKENDPYRKPIFTSSHKYIETLERRTEGWLTNHGTVIYKNQSVKDVGGYTKPGRYQDVDLWKRMYKAGKKIRTLANVLYAWRKADVK